jgi:hypothetical protein
MTLTISLEEPLAGQLRQHASARSMSPEEAARSILAAELGRARAEEAWRQSNERRAALISKELRSGLTAEEKEELETLQAEGATWLAPVDGQLIAGAEDLLRRARELRDAARP